MPIGRDVGVLVGYLKDFAPDLLRGFFDAEGYATCYVDAARARVGNFHLGVADADMTYLASVNELVRGMGISTKIRRTSRAGTQMRIG